MSAETTPEIDWDTYEPTAAVHKAALVLSSADTVDATCFGWVPQAREALSTALDVEEMARAADPQAFEDMDPTSNRSIALRYVARRRSATEHAERIRASILGADS